MNNFKSALRTMGSFMRPSRSYITIYILFPVMGLALIFLSAFKGANPGSDDYLLSICSCGLGMMFCVIIIATGFSRITNRFFYSTPYAKAITVDIFPLIGTAAALINSALAIILNFIELSSGNLTGNRISDLLIFLGYSSFTVILSSGLANIIWLAWFMAWLPGIPFYVWIFVGEVPNSLLHDTMLNGFGISTYISAIIFAAFIIAGLLLARLIASASYNRRSTRFMQNTANTSAVFK